MINLVMGDLSGEGGLMLAVQGRADTYATVCVRERDNESLETGGYLVILRNLIGRRGSVGWSNVRQLRPS